MRFLDVKNLKNKDLKNDFHKDTPIKVIEKKQHKTKGFVFIPIVSRAQKLISESSFKEKKVFKVLSSQPTNRYLKDIAKAANIDKLLTFHVARHTLATNCIELKMPIEIVSKLLGHTDIKTTEIYAKVSNKAKTDYMFDAWN